MRRYLVLLSFVLAACGGGGDGGPVPVASVSVSAPSTNLFVGQTVQLAASPKDENATVLTGRSVTWSSESNAIATVSSAGVVTAVSPGQVRILATSEGKTGSVLITVTRVPVASVTVSPQGPVILVNQTVQLQATVRDGNGNIVTDRSVNWSSSDQTKATVSNTGLVTGVAAGGATITAESEGVTGFTQVAINLPPNAPQISGITPALLIAGVTGVTITGTNFSSAPASNLVTIDGVAATVTAATPTQLTISLPATGFACEPTHLATVSVTVGGVAAMRQHPLQVARQIALAPGQSDLVLDPALVRCNELSVTGGRYTLSVFNTSTSINAASAFQLRGAAPTALAGAPVAGAAAVVNQRAVPAATSSIPRSARDRYAFDARNRRKSAALHSELLEQNRRILERTGSPIHLLQRARANQSLSLRTSGAAQMPISGNVGDTSSVKIAKIKAFPTAFCSNDTTIRARTVYSGTRSIIVEDVNNPLANTMDSYFQAIGTEFDNVMFPILQTNFGNPLAMDSQLDNNGKIVMVFSNVVNVFGGLAGFVVSCDFFPTSTFSASNVGETFYAFVPNNASPGFLFQQGQLTRDEWRRAIRSTIIHEAKHITSFAERISRNAATFEDTWLEEGTAFYAEELWSRTVYFSVWLGNTTYQASLYCDVRPTFPECSDRPFVMFDHFALMYDYLADNEAKSPLSNPGSDFTFYASTWSLVRWIVDKFSRPEEALTLALTQDGSRAGVASLEAHSGRLFPEILGSWSLSHAVDDVPGFLTQDPLLTHPSWNTRDIFARMNQDFPEPQNFPRVFPLIPRQALFGNFTIDVPSLRSGTSSFFELSGTQTSKQIVELRSQGGGDPPSTLRIGFVRVQ